MRPQDVRLPAPMADELGERARALLELGTLGADPGPGAAEAMAELAERLRNNYPYPDPMYAGPDAQAAGARGLGRVRHGDAAEPQQPRAGRRPGHGRAGARGRGGAARRCSACPPPDWAT